MPEVNTLVLIGKAIREGKYLSITYRNKSGETTPFWIRISNINSNGELFVDMFNITKEQPILDAKIFISSIQKIEILKFSHYEVSKNLILKISEDKSLLKYNFNGIDNNVLAYYQECYKANTDPFLHSNHLIERLDLNELIKRNPYQLSTSQQDQIIKEIYHNDYNRFNDYELAISEFSIDLESKGKFVVAFRTLTFDPIEKSLQIGSKIHFNPNFFIQDIKYSLSYYTNISPADFQSLYLEDKKGTIEQLRSNFRLGELPNTRPEIIVLGYAKIDISDVYDEISVDHSKGDLKAPLRAFFQNLSLLDRRNRKEPHIVLYDNNVNIDQLQTIYNSLKYPITYVQGPPGTGKTQTILNIVVNCLTNNKTLLISSNNNIPIDGIKEKLSLGEYKKKAIKFPIIRLGNNRWVAAALQEIRNLYEFQTRDAPKEELLYKLKEKSRAKNRELQEKLSNYEERIDLTQNLAFIQGLLSKGRYDLLEREKEKLEKRLQEIPETTDESVKGIFEVIKDNNQLLQFFYYESLRYVKRLKSKAYSELIEIVYLENTSDQVKEFNKWLSIDENLEKFTKVFPIVLTTNISSRKLGRKYKFDLLAIDEAGQCDVATSLVPISKCSNLILIGDTNQLKPIVLFDEMTNDQLMEKFKVDKTYDYFNNSILSAYSGIDNISRNILLRYHYRCGRKIINYSNMRFYENRLNLNAVERPGNIKLVDVNNVSQKNRNSQIEESRAIVQYIRENDLTDVYIITPFRNQEQVLNHFLKEAKENKEIDDTVSCGTIHKVQGQENKTIIISTAISRKTGQGTYDWIKNNSQLINVGVTRAKENLIVVTDRKAIDIISKKDDDLYALIKYVEKNGTVEVSQSAVNKFAIGFSNDSKFEDEFYKTMNHYCSVRGSQFRRNVKVTEVFPEETNNDQVNKKEFDGVLYEGRIPKVVFELNGREHYERKSTIKSDKAKMELLKTKGLKHIFITNQYVKHYEFIRELMNKFNGDIYQKTLFDGYD